MTRGDLVFNRDGLVPFTEGSYSFLSAIPDALYKEFDVSLPSAMSDSYAPINDLYSCMNHTGRPAGFSLIELVIVLAIMGILAAVAGSRIVNARTDAQINVTVTEANRLNRLAMVAQQLNGKLPDDVNQGLVPTELRPPLFANSFQLATPVGGLWDWNGPGTTIPHMGMSIYFLSTSAEPSGIYSRLDTKFDDANAATGKIRRHVTGGKVFWCFLIQ